jgi:hypothetical protein
MAQNTPGRLQPGHKNSKADFTIHGIVNNDFHKDIEPKVAEPEAAPAGTPLHENGLQELQEMKARFESMVSYPYSYPYHSWKAKQRYAKIFLSRLNPRVVKHSLTRILKSFLF